jgi:hypothetical protein
MKNLILALALLLCGSANASCLPLNENDQKWFIASNVAILADWATTRDMVRQKDKGYEEVGPIARKVIGAHPTGGQIDAYMLTRLAANYYFVCKLEDRESLHIYLIATTMAHSMAAANNYSIGLRIRF